MNRIRKVGKQEMSRANESGNHEARKAKQSCLLVFSCIPFFLIHSSSAADVVIGSKKFTESYVLGEIAKRTLIDAGIPALVNERLAISPSTYDSVNFFEPITTSAADEE